MPCVIINKYHCQYSPQK
uniref:Uncharacterized protein n=1 Tax=Anguilla anguilla TaxID=7936 RepID=A0A0E9QUF3_ANGAN